MSAVVLFAEEQDENELSEILLEYGMDIPGEIEEQLIVKENERVVAGAKIIEVEANNFYLEVLGVKQDNLYQGIGRLLMTEIVQNPWKCCKHPISDFEAKGSYNITTIARGYATDFYVNIGFTPCEFLKIPESFREQCSDCPDKESCEPVPMEYVKMEEKKSYPEREIRSESIIAK